MHAARRMSSPIRTGGGGSRSSRSRSQPGPSRDSWRRRQCRYLDQPTSGATSRRLCRRPAPSCSTRAATCSTISARSSACSTRKDHRSEPTRARSSEASGVCGTGSAIDRPPCPARRRCVDHGWGPQVDPGGRWLRRSGYPDGTSSAARSGSTRTTSAAPGPPRFLSVGPVEPASHTRSSSSWDYARGRLLVKIGDPNRDTQIHVGRCSSIGRDDGRAKQGALLTFQWVADG